MKRRGKATKGEANARQMRGKCEANARKCEANARKCEEMRENARKCEANARQMRGKCEANAIKCKQNALHAKPIDFASPLLRAQDSALLIVSRHLLEHIID